MASKRSSYVRGLALASTSLLASLGWGQQAIDGTADYQYGAPIVCQNVDTSFGDNLSELDVAYAYIKDGVLYLTLAGNLENNSNKLNIFIDSVSGGQNRLRGDNWKDTIGTSWNLTRMGDSGGTNGLTFETGFAADYYFSVNRSGGNLYVDYSATPDTANNIGYFLGQSDLSLGFLSGGSNPNNVKANYNGANAAGVGSGNTCGYAKGGTVATGLEMAIPLAAIGSPSGAVKILAFVGNGDNSSLSNQFLPGCGYNAALPVDSFGEPRGTGNTPKVNLGANTGSVVGTQYFVAPYASGGNLAVLRFSSTTGSSNCAAVFVDEYTTSGTLLSTKALPTSVSGSQLRLTIPGANTNDGLLQRSGDGRFITMAGYDQAVGSTTGTSQRVVGYIDRNGTVDTSTGTNLTSGTIRSAYTLDGSMGWFADSGGIKYVTLGSVGSASVYGTNSRAVTIFNSQLHGGRSANVETIGTTLPTSGSSTAGALIAGAGYCDFYFADALTLYAASDDTSGGVRKWVYNTTTKLWESNLAFYPGTGKARSITGTKNNLGQNVIYFVAEYSATSHKVMSFVDDGTQTPALTTVVTNGSGVIIRGVDFSPYTTPVNNAPTLNAIGNQAGNELSNIGFTATASDPDAGQTLTFSLVGAPAGASINPSTGLFTFTPTEAQGPGSYTFDVVVTDNGSPNLSDSETITVTVGEVNQPPTLNNPGNQVATEMVALNLQLTGSDADLPANTLTYGKVSGPAALTVSPSGAVAWTPGESDGGTNPTVVVSLNDGTATVQQTFSINVSEANQNPVLDNPGPQTATEGTAFSLQLTGHDDDVPAQTLTYSKVGGPASLSVSGSGLVTWTPGENDGGTTPSVTVSLSDGQASVQQTFTITVSEVNEPPVLDAIGNKTLDELTPLSLDANATDPDVPAQSLIYSIIDAPAGMTINPTTGVVTWTPTEAQGPGDYTFTVKVTDNGSPNLSDEEQITVHVNEVNQAPTWGSIPNQMALETTPYTLNLALYASDADIPANNLTFSKVSGPTGLTVSPAGLVSWTPGETDGNTQPSVTVRVTDDGTPNLYADKTFLITVEEKNEPPVLDPIGPKSGDELSAITFTATASDPDVPANGLTFSLVGAPAGASIDPNSGVFTFTPTETQGPGSYTFDVKVTDDGSPNLSDTETITVTVNEVNAAPTLNPIGNKSGDELTLITFTSTASDPDVPANTLTFSLVGAPAGASIDPSTGVFTWTPTEAQGPNDYTFDVKVTDDGSPNLSDTETITVTVNEVNEAPVLNPIGNKTVNELATLSFTATASDPDDPANVLTFSLVGAPAGASIDPSTGAFTFTPTEAQGPGSYTFDVKVTDDGSPNLSDTETITVTVNEVNAAPTLNPIGNKSGDELTLITFTATASDPDVPNNTLTFSLVGAPAGASIDPSTGVFTWTPTEAQGPNDYTFTVKVADDGSPTLSDEEEITVHVNEVNVAPTANAQSVSTNEDTAKAITLTASDPDIPANTLTWSYTQPAHGTVTGTAPNVTYTPAANYNGPDSFTFTVNDGTVDSNTATVSITVDPVNDPPTAVDDPYSTNMNTPLHVAAAGVLANDTDIDGGALSAVLVDNVSHGTLTLNPDGSFDYTPTTNFHGDDTFTYKANDGAADSNVATVTITVVQTNQPPVATNVNTSTPEDTAKLITLTASDPDTDPLTYSIVSGPSHGNLSAVTLNQVTYTPNLNYNGNDTFTFKANDGTADSNIATVTITVTPVNDLTVEVYGSPAPNAFGSTNWGPYRDNALNSLENGLGDIGDRTVTPDAYQQVTNIPWRDVVVSGFFSWRGVAGSPVPFNAEYGNRLHFGLRVLGNGTRFSLSQLDFDVASDDPTNSLGFVGSFDGTDEYSASRKGIDYGPDRVKGGGDDTIIMSGSATQEVDELIYVGVGNALDATFEPGLTDQDKLNSVRCYVEQLAPIHVTGAYKIRDGLGGFLGQGQTVVRIVPTNTLPVAQNQLVTVPEDGSTPITLVATDADNEALTYTVLSGPTHGTLTGTEPNLTYTPDADYFGPDSFTFKARDCVGDSNIATVTINVTAVNDDPILGAVGNQTVDELTPLSFTLTSSDVDGGAPTYSYTGAAAGLTVNPSTGQVTWTPTEAQGPGDYSATFTVNDGAGGIDTETISIHVNEVNVAPTANAQSVSTDEDTAKAITLTASDPDIPANTLTWSYTQPAHGTVTGTAPNVTYTPAENYHGPDSFTFKVNDGTVDSNTATVSITVDPVNDAPVADSQSVSTAEDTSTPITLGASDVDNDPLTYTIVNAPQFGTLTGTGANRSYTPNLNFNGNDSFTFKVNDGTVDSNIATVSITVTPVQDVVMTVVGTPAPNSFGGASWNGYLANAINSLRNGLGNVGDRNTDPTAYEEVTQIPWKDIAVTGFESWRGEAHPAAPFDGEYGVRLHFGVHVLGNGDRISLARLKVDMSSTDPINELGFSQDFGTLGTPYSTRRTGIDWGPDRKRGTSDDFVLNSGEPGTTLCDELVLVGLGNAFDTYSESPFTDQEKLDELRCYIETRAPFDVTSLYTLRDGLGNPITTSSATVNVMATNTLPTAQNQTVTTPVNTPVDITLVATDPDNETLAYQVVSGPSHGTLTGTAPDLTYTPDTNFVGTDSFVFKASDCVGDSNLATVTIIVGSPLTVNFTVRQKGVDADVSRVIEFTVGGTGGANNRITLRKVVNFNTPATVDSVPSREGTLTLAYADLDLADNNALDNSVPANAVFTKAYVKDPFFSLGKSVSVTGSAGTYSATADLILGDLTNNNVVNVADLAVWAAYNGTGQSPNTVLGQPAAPRQANLDGLGGVDLSDRQMVLAAYLTAGDGNDVGPYAAGNGSKRVMDIVLETGLSKATVRSMDLDGDGWVTREEVLAWSRGNR